MGGLHTFFKVAEIILSNPVVLFFLVLFASEWCFGYLQPLVLKNNITNRKQRIFISGFNGIVFMLTAFHLDSITPVILLTGTPLLIMVELVLMSKDRIFTYMYMLIKLWVNFICVYWMIASIIGIISAQYVSGELVFPLTLLGCGLLSLLMSRHPKYPRKELKIILHRKSIGFLHFIFLSSCAISLFFSTIVLRPIMVEDIMAIGSVRGIQQMFFIEMFLKTSLVFTSVYLLLFMQARELREKENLKVLSMELEKEEDYRRSTQQEAFLSFYVNATADQIQEGRDLFTAFMWQDINNYAEMLQKMAFLCIYPDHLMEFVAHNSLFTIEEKMEQGINTGKQKVKVHPKEMVSLFNLPANIREKYLNTQDEWVWIKIRYVYLKDSETDDIYIHVSISDINEKMRKSEQLVLNATIDKLTGIYNRATLQSMIEERLKLAKREGKNAGTMILLDVDSFKSVNDKLGHPTGDVALQTVAENLKGIFRSNDIVGRLGGDEFCIFMQGTTDEGIIRSRLEQINILCRKDYPVPGEEAIHVSVSIGAVICSNVKGGYEEIYAMADEALYHTKEKGKNSYTLYSDLKNNQVLQ